MAWGDPYGGPGGGGVSVGGPAMGGPGVGGIGGGMGGPVGGVSGGIGGIGGAAVGGPAMGGPGIGGVSPGSVGGIGGAAVGGPAMGSSTGSVGGIGSLGGIGAGLGSPSLSSGIGTATGSPMGAAVGGPAMGSSFGGLGSPVGGLGSPIGASASSSAGIGSSAIGGLSGPIGGIGGMGSPIGASSSVGAGLSSGPVGGIGGSLGGFGSPQAAMGAAIGAGMSPSAAAAHVGTMMGGPANSGAGVGASGFGGLGSPIGGAAVGGPAMGASSGFGAGATFGAGRPNLSGAGTMMGSGSVSPQRQSPSANSLGPNTYGGGFGTPGQGLYGPSMNLGPAGQSLMARAMVSEAGPGAPPQAMQGVGDVIANRMMSGQYPSTVSGVVNQPGQFSVVGSGAINRVNPSTPGYSTARGLAGAIASGELPSTVGTSLNFGNLNTINNKPGYSSTASKTAFNNMSPQYNIGGHTFGTIGSTNNVPSSRMGMAAPGTAQAFNGMPGAGLGAMAALNGGAVNPTSIASVGGPSQSLSSVNPAGSPISQVGPSQLSQIGPSQLSQVGSGSSLSPLSAAAQLPSVGGLAMGAASPTQMQTQTIQPTRPAPAPTGILAGLQNLGTRLASNVPSLGGMFSPSPTAMQPSAAPPTTGALGTPQSINQVMRAAELANPAPPATAPLAPGPSAINRTPFSPNTAPIGPPATTSPISPDLTRAQNIPSPSMMGGLSTSLPATQPPATQTTGPSWASPVKPVGPTPTTGVDQSGVVGIRQQYQTAQNTPFTQGGMPSKPAGPISVGSGQGVGADTPAVGGIMGALGRYSEGGRPGGGGSNERWFSGYAPHGTASAGYVTGGGSSDSGGGDSTPWNGGHPMRDHNGTAWEGGGGNDPSHRHIGGGGEGNERGGQPLFAPGTHPFTNYSGMTPQQLEALLNKSRDMGHGYMQAKKTGLTWQQGQPFYNANGRWSSYAPGAMG